MGERTEGGSGGRGRDWGTQGERPGGRRWEEGGREGPPGGSRAGVRFLGIGVGGVRRGAQGQEAGAGDGAARPGAEDADR